MNANELNARQLDIQGRQAAATAMPQDAESLRVVREAQENARREQARRLMDQDELFRLFKHHERRDLHPAPDSRIQGDGDPGDSR